MALDHAKRMLNLGPHLCFRVFDLAANACDQTLFGVLFIVAWASGNRPDHLAIFMLDLLVHAGIARIATHT